MKARKKQKSAMARLGFAVMGGPKAEGDAGEPRKVSFVNVGAPAATCPVGRSPVNVFVEEEGGRTRGLEYGRLSSSPLPAKLSFGCSPEFASEGGNTGGSDSFGIDLPIYAATPTQVLPSRGSALHASGTCRPCAWFWRPGGCQNAEECSHCHLCENGELKTRKKEKQTMLRLGLATPCASQCTSAEGASFVCEESTRTPDKNASLEKDSTTASGSEQETADLLNSSPLQSASEDGGQVATGPVATGRGGSQVRLPPGLQAPRGTPSQGSALHQIGDCWPCASFWKSGGCQEDRHCRYCHLCPNGELHLRKRSKRAVMRLGLATPKAVPPEEDCPQFEA